MAITEQKEIDRLKADLENLRKDFSKLTDSLKRMSTDRINAGTDAARASASRLRDQARGATHSLEHEFQEHPLTGILGALGIGLLLGTLLDRMLGR